MLVQKMLLHGIVMLLTVPSFWSTRVNHQKDLNVDSLAPLKSPPGVLLNISTQREEDVVVKFKDKDFKFRPSGTGEKVAIILRDTTAYPFDDTTKGLQKAGYRVLMQMEFVDVPSDSATGFGPMLQELAKTTKLPMLVGVGRGVDLAAQVAHDLQGSVEHLALVEAHRSDRWATLPWTFHAGTKVAVFHSQEGDGDFTVKGQDIFTKFGNQAMLFQMRGKTEELITRSFPTLTAFALPSLDRDAWTPGPEGPDKLPYPVQGGAKIGIKTLTGASADVDIFDKTIKTSVGDVLLRQFGERKPGEASKKVAFAFGGGADKDFNAMAPEWTHVAAHLALNGFVVFVPCWQQSSVPDSGESWALALQEIAKADTGSTDEAKDIELPLLMGKCAGGGKAFEVSKVLKNKVHRRVFVVPAAGEAKDVSGFGPTAIFYGKDDNGGFGPDRQKVWQTFAKDEALVFQANRKEHHVLGDYIPHVVDFALGAGPKPDRNAAGFPASGDPGDETPWYKKFSTFIYAALFLIFIGAAAYGVYYFKFRQDPDASESSSSGSSARGRDAK